MHKQASAAMADPGIAHDRAGTVPAALNDTYDFVFLFSLSSIRVDSEQCIAHGSWVEDNC